MNEPFVHDLGRYVFHFGWIWLSWYVFMAICVVVFGFALWYWQARRGGLSRKVTWTALPWICGCLFLGIRLVHIFFYAPKYYFSDPIRFLEVWNGGFASHGAVIGVAVGFFTFTRKFNLPFLKTFDRFCFSGALGAACVRVGNFFNSEVVGRATDLPCGVRFMNYYDGGRVIRHPVQLYECALALLTLVVLLAADRLAGREERPVGLMVALALVVYFGGRFFLEFTKEYQILTPHISPLTMGHYLSLPMIAVGLWMLARIWKRRPSG